mgnify:FL=1
MNSYDFYLSGEKLSALSSGGLYWSDKKILCVSDLHFGKAHRLNRTGAGALPPYENIDTLKRLQADICATNPSCVICLGDSFDDRIAEQSFNNAETHLLKILQKDRDWIWISGNHDPYPSLQFGESISSFSKSSITFRHIALKGEIGEISGHYHPKISINLSNAQITRACFIADQKRVIMPAYGTYTGGLSVRSDEIKVLFENDATVMLTGNKIRTVPYSSCF